MKAHLILYEKGFDELGNTIEVKMWQLPTPTEDNPHGYKYSLVYIVDDIRVIGYDNAEEKGIFMKQQMYIVLSVFVIW
jgi:hypothetical protein